jgi:hypothetical protein
MVLPWAYMQEKQQRAAAYARNKEAESDVREN